MAYVKVNWATGVTPLSEANMDHLETQYDEVANLFDAHSILIAVADNTPIVLTVVASRIVGRAAAGNIVALTGAQVLTIIGRIGVANLNWTAAKLLLGAGAGVNPTEVDLPVVTKEIWVPITATTGGGTMINIGDFACGRLVNAAQEAVMSFKVPHDWTAITTAEVVVVCRATQAAADWDINSDYAAVGEVYNTHSEADVASTYNVTNNEIEVVDISGILTALATDDYVGIRFTQSHNDHDVDVLGVRFRYS